MMNRFAFPTPRSVKVTNVNPRREKHGKTNVGAIDVSMEITAPNTWLDELKGPELRAALYKPATDDDEVTQPDLDGVAPASDTPLLRLDGLQPIGLDDELTGYTVTFDLGMGRKESVVELFLAKLNKFQITPLQGGSVRVHWRVQAAGIKEREYGKLCTLIDAEVGVKLEPPLFDGVLDGSTSSAEPAEKPAAKASKLQRRIGQASRRAAKKAPAKKARG